MKSKFAVLTFLLVLFIVLRTPFAVDSHQSFHSPEEINFYQVHFLPPLDSGEFFALPENCKGCHGFDSLGLANVDLNGMDVNLFDDWETSMMALAAVDPFWKAKVSHEVLVNPAHASELQTLCTTCHAPLGHYDAFYRGATEYTLADLAIDSLGQSGVSCHSCHGIKDSTDLGVLFTGAIPFDTNRIVYGPFAGPMQGPMQLYAGLLPAYGPHMSDSKSCSPCHTLISNTVDLSGTPTGGKFIEQATYHEYLNSSYVGQSTCQTCHMPKIEDPVKIANGYTALPGRTPFNLHTFSGANNFMVQLIKNNKAQLGVIASDENFDSTLAANTKLLREQTLELTTHYDTTLNDTAFFSMQVLNKAGHKFPSGYPSRRAVVQFVALKANGDTLFASGLFDSNFEVVNNPATWQTHYDIIGNQSETQIYEMVIGDVNGDRTTVLERGDVPLKDNRIPPLGFTTMHLVYDTCKIIGDALSDPDFNKIASVEGSGADIVHYHIPLLGYSGLLNIKAKVFYQVIPPGWLSEMQNYSSAEIDSFMAMFNAADRSPFLVAEDSIDNIPIPVGSEEVYFSKLSIHPNPTYDGLINIEGLNGKSLTCEIYSSSGSLIKKLLVSKQTSVVLLPDTKGIYYLVLRSGKKQVLHKIIRL
jgi:hypothetical protein